jgi:ABC-type lipoprotein release transport system permease subunit
VRSKRIRTARRDATLRAQVSAPAKSSLAAGVVVATAMARALEQLVPDARLNMAIIGAAAAALFVTALIATLLPALRAVNVDPLAALRTE